MVLVVAEYQGCIEDYDCPLWCVQPRISSIDAHQLGNFLWAYGVCGQKEQAIPVLEAAGKELDSLLDENTVMQSSLGKILWACGVLPAGALECPRWLVLDGLSLMACPCWPVLVCLQLTVIGCTCLFVVFWRWWRCVCTRARCAAVLGLERQAQPFMHTLVHLDTEVWDAFHIEEMANIVWAAVKLQSVTRNEPRIKGNSCCSACICDRLNTVTESYRVRRNTVRLVCNRCCGVIVLSLAVVVS